MALTFNFHGQLWNLLYLSQKWSHCHETKSKRIDWTLGLKQDHPVWPWPWSWPWIFQVKHGICSFLTKDGPIAMKLKQSYRLNFRPQVGPSSLTLAMTLNCHGQIGNSLYLTQNWSHFPQTKFRHTDLMPGGKSAVAVFSNDEQCEPDITDNDLGNFRWRCAVNSSSLKCTYPGFHFTKDFSIMI